MVQQVYAALTRVVVASPLPEAAWYSAAEAALTAIYTLHPAPEHLSGAILKHLARAAFAGAGADAEPEASTAGQGQQGGAEGEQEEKEAEDMEADAPADAQDGEEAAEGEAAAAPAESQPAASQAARSMHAVVPLSRFFFALGHIALQHLVRCRFGWRAGGRGGGAG